MVYLSRLMVSPRCRQVRSEIDNPFEMHRTLSRVFGDGGESMDDAQVLYRIDIEPHPHVLIQTKSAPDWSKLCVVPDYLSAPPEVKNVNPIFQVGDQFTFRLRANPTLRTHGKRFGLYSQEEQAKWLERKSEHGGFHVEKLTIRQDDCLEVRGAGERVAKFATVQYDGQLVVLNPLMFSDAFENGVGAAKGMGFGLLSLARC